MNKPFAPISTESTLEPGKYWAWLGANARQVEIREDIDAGCLVVKFEGSERCQRLDEMNPSVTFTKR